MLEHELWSRGVKHVVGVDEVGRGAAAGPVLAAAVLLPVSWSIDGVKDSKKLTPRRRSQLRSLIEETATAFAYATRDNKTIDEINIRNATLDAMREAVKRIARDHPIDLVLVDGVDLIPDLRHPQRSVIDGEDHSLSIAAASIVAKVTRDEMMVRLDEEFEGRYGWTKNKGYLTKEHSQSISQFGPTDYHRHTFIKRLIAG